MNLNKLFIGGNLTRDPELRHTPKGTAVCKFGVAVNRKWKNEAGEEKEEATFVDIDAFGRLAENIAKYFKKGRPIMVVGRLRLDVWDDKQSGQKKTKLAVVAEEFQFCGGDSDSSRSASTAPHARTAAPAAAPVAGDGPPESDDLIPF